MPRADDPVRLGIDIGGTKTRLGLVDTTGRVLRELTVPSRADMACGPFLADTLAIASRLARSCGLTLNDLVSIGIGVPGTVHIESGTARYCPNLDWHDEPVADHVERIIGRRPAVLQDSWCAAWAERTFGSAPETTSFLTVTIGTGIGAGLVLDGQLFFGALGAAGELGHTIVHTNGRPCTCGRQGCLEQYSSGTAIARLGNERLAEGAPLTAPDVFLMAARGRRGAQDILDEAIEELAQALSNAVNVLSVEQVVIGGGLGSNWGQFVEPLRDRVLALAYRPWLETGRFSLRQSTMPLSAPMIGAAFLDTATSLAEPLTQHIT